MNSPTASPLRLGAPGLDGRAAHLLKMFLRGPCQDRAVLADEGEAEAFLIDLDGPKAAERFATLRKSHPHKPIVVLSLRRSVDAGGVFFVQKPVQVREMLAAIERVRALAPPSDTPGIRQMGGDADVSGMKVIASKEKADASVHKVAMLLDEQGYGTYLGHREEIDPADPKQRKNAYYDPNDHLQSHVQAACRLAFSRKQAIRVETPWKPVTILPQQRLAWVDAEEAQLRAACAIPFRRFVSLEAAGLGQPAAKIERLDADQVAEVLSRQDTTAVDALLWKIALWTSKGRIPCGVDLDHAVRLKRWPNFTRLLVTPHAMRIAALLHQRPCNLFEAARTLGVRQQYVFALFSAAHAQGLVEVQSKPQVEPGGAEPFDVPSRPESTSLLRSLLQRLKRL
jgi:hypothetical protein